MARYSSPSGNGSGVFSVASRPRQSTPSTDRRRSKESGSTRADRGRTRGESLPPPPALRTRAARARRRPVRSAPSDHRRSGRAGEQADVDRRVVAEAVLAESREHHRHGPDDEQQPLRRAAPSRCDAPAARVRSARGSSRSRTGARPPRRRTGRAGRAAPCPRGPFPYSRFPSSGRARGGCDRAIRGATAASSAMASIGRRAAAGTIHQRATLSRREPTDRARTARTSAIAPASAIALTSAR